MEFEPFGKCLSLGDFPPEHEEMFFMVLLFKCIAPECTLSGTKPAACTHQNSSFSKYRKLILWTQFESRENIVSSASPKSSMCMSWLYPSNNYLMSSLICNRHNLHIIHISLAITTSRWESTNDYVDHHCE